MSDHLGLDFRDRVSASVEVAAWTGAGVRGQPVCSKVPVEVNSRTNEAKVAAETPRLSP